MEWINNIREFTNESLLIQLAIIIAATKLAGIFSDKLKQPTVFGKLLIGIIIGPSFLGIIHESPTLNQLADLGVIVLMFLAGLETNVDEFKKAGFAATLTAVGGIALPLAVGTLYAMAYGFKGLTPLFIGTVLTATSVSISAQTLRELGKLKSKIGMTILGAAVIDDVLGIVVLTLLLGLAGIGTGSGGFVELSLLIVKMVLFFVITTYFGKMAVAPVLKWLHKKPVSHGLTAGALIFVFLFAFIAEKCGVANITGAYIAGIIMGTTHYKDEILEKSEALGYSFLIPVFFVGIGLRANIGSINSGIVFVIILSFIAVITKIIGCGAGAKISGLNWKKSLTVGTGMISRGEIALIMASIGLNKDIIQYSLYTAIIIMVLVTTVVTPPMLKYVIHWTDRKKTEAMIKQT